MAVTIAVILSQLAAEPTSVMLLKKALQIPRRRVELRLRELASNGVLVKEGGNYAVNPELFRETLEDAKHVRRLRSIIIGGAKKLKGQLRSGAAIASGRGKSKSLLSRFGSLVSRHALPCGGFFCQPYSA